MSRGMYPRDTAAGSLRVGSKLGLPAATGELRALWGCFRYLRPMASKAVSSQTRLMDKPSTDLSKVVLVVIGLGLLAGQFMIPAIATDVGSEYYEVTHLVTPYSVLGILTLAVLQVGLAMIWKLLSLVSTGMIFSPGSLKWVNSVIVCLAVATLLPSAALFHLIFIVGLGGPGVLMLFAATGVIGLALVLLMFVMRGLLGDAISDRVQLDELSNLRFG